MTRTLILLLLVSSAHAQLRTRVAVAAPNAVELGVEYVQTSKAFHLSYGAATLTGRGTWAGLAYVNVGYGGTKADKAGTTPLIGVRVGYQGLPLRERLDGVFVAPYVAIRGKRTWEAFFRYGGGLLSNDATQFGGGVAVVF